MSLDGMRIDIIRYEPHNLSLSLNTTMQRTANENAVGLSTICKISRSDQQKIERLET